jgi:hypothetical protein
LGGKRFPSFRFHVWKIYGDFKKESAFKNGQRKGRFVKKKEA